MSRLLVAILIVVMIVLAMNWDPNSAPPNCRVLWKDADVLKWLRRPTDWCDAMPSIRDFNKEMEKSRELSGTLKRRTTSRHQAVIEHAGTLEGKDELEYLEEQKERAEKEVVAYKSQLRIIEAQICNLTSGMMGDIRIATGNKVLQEAEDRHEETEAKRQAAQERVADLHHMIRELHAIAVRRP